MLQCYFCRTLLRSFKLTGCVQDVSLLMKLHGCVILLQGSPVSEDQLHFQGRFMILKNGQDYQATSPSVVLSPSYQRKKFIL